MMLSVWSNSLKQEIISSARQAHRYGWILQSLRRGRSIPRVLVHNRLASSQWPQSLAVCKHESERKPRTNTCWHPLWRWDSRRSVCTFLFTKKCLSASQSSKLDTSHRLCNSDAKSRENASRSKAFVEKVSLPEEDEQELLYNTGHEFESDILEETDNPDILEYLADIPLMPETYTLVSYVDHSKTLQNLVQIGVDLSKLERRKGVASMLLKMDFDRDIKEKLAFLYHVGIHGEKLGSFVTKNPFILGEELQDLEARVQYLLEMGFSEAAISQIVNRAPYFLNFSVERIDNKLGYYQQLFGYSNSNIRELITRCPKLVTMKVSRPKENLFVLEFQCGFSKDALRSMVLKEPAILLRGKSNLIATFDYLHNVMNVPHKIFLKSPEIFHGQVFRVRDRHKYLTFLKRNQYDPTMPGYVPVMALFKSPDHAFCEDIAKTSLEEYDMFLKTCRT